MVIAPKNYEGVGFVLYNIKENNDEAAFSGDYIKKMPNFTAKLLGIFF